MISLNTPTIYALKVARKTYGTLFGHKTVSGTGKEFSPDQSASDMIEAGIRSDDPFMVARLGAVELSCIANYLSVRDNKKKFFDYIQGRSEAFWWDKNTLFLMSNNAGFFPTNPEMLARFSELMMNDMKEVDILGSWLPQERLFSSQLAKAKKVSLFDLEPYNHFRPWSAALTGKKVLVVHPFVHSIREQYKKRHLLFPNNEILPQFELHTIKAVQSIANSKTGFNNWFEALDHMKEQIEGTHFDIAIIGCGAYGFPLAAHVKRMGKKAVHLGGATQTLFGIKGKRWEEKKEHRIVASMMNEHWTRPQQEETPQGIRTVEGGCYW